MLCAVNYNSFIARFSAAYSQCSKKYLMLVSHWCSVFPEVLYLSRYSRRHMAILL